MAVTSRSAQPESGSVEVLTDGVGGLSVGMPEVATPSPVSPFPRTIRGLIFAVDNVFYDATLWQRWLFRLLSRMGMHTHYDAFFEHFRAEFLDDVHRGQRDFWDALRGLLLASGLKTGQIDEITAAGHAWQRDLEDDTRPFPGVRSTLAELAAGGALLGVLSNCESSADRLSARLAGLALPVQFDAVVTSYDLHCTKPDPSCYRAALSALGLAAHEAAYVAQDAEDLAGASATGLHTVAFNHLPEVVADVYLDDFEQLLQAVQLAIPRQRSA